jgi:AcrR family transcriptional regulator
MADKKATIRTGRPRSIESQQAILDATWKLLKKISVRDLSIEGIAKEAGVGKTTIYRWWSSKTAVVVDAFMTRVITDICFRESDNAQEELLKQIASVAKALSGENGRIVAEIIAEGQTDKEALQDFRDRFLFPRREAAKQVIIQGIKTGEFNSNLDLELTMDILYGPIYYRLLLGHLPLNQEFSSLMPEMALKCLKKG